MRLHQWLWTLLSGKRTLTAQIAGYGILVVDLDSANYAKIHSESLLNGYRHEGKNRHDPVFAEITDTVTAQTGKTFGISFYFLVNNSHKETNIEITTRILHPVMTHPQTQQQATGQTDTFIYTAPYYQYHYFTFEYDYELVKGHWTFQVWQADTLFLEKQFIVR